MPMYVYRCRECEKVFEINQKIKDAPLKKCVDCDGEVNRLIQPIGVIFNGPGFYVNDYKSIPKEAGKET